MPSSSTLQLRHAARARRDLSGGELLRVYSHYCDYTVLTVLTY
jgi:hypothetical protein